MNDWIDLHLHSDCSDGADTPEQVMIRAFDCGAAAVALTDHDTVKGVGAARQKAEALGMRYLNGVEISASFESNEMHILGLGIAPNAAQLGVFLDEASKERLHRAVQIMERLDKAEVASRAQMEPYLEDLAQPGRIHVAVALHELGVVRRVQEAFDRYLNRGCAAFVPKTLPSAEKVIQVIHDAGGLAFVAHPGLGYTLRKRLGVLLRLPFDGIEVWHISHTTAMIHRLKGLAEERGLLLTGGSDCHGDIKKERPVMGRVRAPYSCYEKIEEALAQTESDNDIETVPVTI
ncbi:MAG: PHP domain-containing protein [Candidatus Hydrogenedentes bacterium]|nr:PHP domain-containing protein [Candidatus Hydrogenedentota bacterium]